MTLYKTCSQCNKTKPITDFHKCSANSDGYKGKCKQCRNQYQISYESEKRRKNQKVNRTKVLFGLCLLYNERYCSTCKTIKPIDEFNQSSIVCKVCRAPRDKRYKETHKETIREFNIEYKIKNRLKLREKDLEYIRSPHGKNIRTKYAQSPHGKSVISNIGHKRRCISELMENTLTEEQWQKILNNQKNKCAMCGKPFDEKRKPQKDHLIPVSRGVGLTYENTQALCQSCNSKKRDKLDLSKITTWSDLVFIESRAPLTYSELKIMEELGII